MGLTYSHADAPGPDQGAAVKVGDLLEGESTQTRGSDALNDQGKPAAVSLDANNTLFVLDEAPVSDAPSIDEKTSKEASVPPRLPPEAEDTTNQNAVGYRDTVKDEAEENPLEAHGEKKAMEVAERQAEEITDEDAPEGTSVVELRTAPMDPRFPTSNAARYCFVAYNEYYKCKKEKGEDYPECNHFRRNYRSLCPDEWIERWEELRENGTWFGKY